MFYSPSMNGFFQEQGDLPDAVEISEQLWMNLLEGQGVGGQEIHLGEDGVPALRAPPAAPVSPVMVVSMYQARAALLHAGLLDDVDAALQAMPAGPEKRQAQLAWEYAPTVERLSPLVSLLSEALELTAEQVDALFVDASLVQ